MTSLIWLDNKEFSKQINIILESIIFIVEKDRRKSTAYRKDMVGNNDLTWTNRCLALKGYIHYTGSINHSLLVLTVWGVTGTPREAGCPAPTPWAGSTRSSSGRQWTRGVVEVRFMGRGIYSKGRILINQVPLIRILISPCCVDMSN